MIILGLDPGYAITGYAFIEYRQGRYKVLKYGVLTTRKDLPFDLRLLQLYEELSSLIQHYQPNLVAIEELFFYKNRTTVIGTAQARGVLVLACAMHNLPIFEYTPMQVKLALTGYGLADKKQMQAMVKQILKLESIPKPDDAADALAIAICQAHTGVQKNNLLVSGYSKGRPVQKNNIQSN